MSQIDKKASAYAAAEEAQIAAGMKMGRAAVRSAAIRTLDQVATALDQSTSGVHVDDKHVGYIALCPICAPDRERADRIRAVARELDKGNGR